MYAMTRLRTGKASSGGADVAISVAFRPGTNLDLPRLIGVRLLMLALASSTLASLLKAECQ